jgi:hypothetical protein
VLVPLLIALRTLAAVALRLAIGLALGILCVVLTALAHMAYSPPGAGMAQPPGFTVKISVLLALGGVLYTLGYATFRDVLPGRNGLVRGLLFGSIVYLSAGASQMLGMIAFDLKGGFDLLSLTKIPTYASIVQDGLPVLIVFGLLGLIYGPSPRRELAWPRGLVRTSALTAVVFPLGMLAVVEGIGTLVPQLDVFYNRPALGASAPWFLSAFYGAFVITGALLPLYYAMTRRRLSGAFVRRGVAAGLLYTLCFWLVIANAIYALGAPLWVCLVFSIESAIVLVATFVLIARQIEGPAPVWTLARA